MSFEFSDINQRKRPLSLQLAPMIDIFTLIIVFLLMSTVLGNVSIVFPRDMKSAKSVSKESVEASPQVIIDKQRVIIDAIKKEYPLSFFANPSGGQIGGLKLLVGEYIKNATNESKNTIVNVNVLADADTPYRDIFSVVKVLRQAGFQSVLFVAEGDSGR